MATELGAVLAERYDLVEVIGRGGVADVYRAHDRVLDRSVAIKLLRDTGVSEADRARFADEARTLARLDHPGLVTLLDVGSTDEQEFLVMQLVEGETLAQRMQRDPIPESEVAEIGHQLADAIAYAHACDVIHRDVKPGNVLLSDDGRTLLADFGIARLVGETGQHTRTGMAIGSPAYLSPEQVSGGDITPAADIYSLGLVLLEALTGRREYDGPSTEAALARLSRPPVIPDDLSPEWRTLLGAMTALEPSVRPTAQQVAVTIPAADPTLIDHPVLTPVGPETRVLSAAPADSMATRAWMPPRQRLRRFGEVLGQRATMLVVLALCVLGLVLLAAAMATDDASPAAPPPVPETVPTELQQPLEDLHDAVHGSTE